jgi:hypothetical protein
VLKREPLGNAFFVIRPDQAVRDELTPFTEQRQAIANGQRQAFALYDVAANFAAT